MRRPLSKIILPLILAALLFVPGASSAQPVDRPAPESLARFPHEVKLRKLHLVRPDLIPYPLFFEVYC